MHNLITRMLIFVSNCKEQILPPNISKTNSQSQTGQKSLTMITPFCSIRFIRCLLWFFILLDICQWLKMQKRPCDDRVLWFPKKKIYKGVFFFGIKILKNIQVRNVKKMKYLHLQTSYCYLQKFLSFQTVQKACVFSQVFWSIRLYHS